MQTFNNFFVKHPGKVFFFLLLLAVPAFFINLGLLPLFADEPTRANVALEMILSKNFSVPTDGGVYYYNKPPFYNWILAGAYLITGDYSEFVTRLPAVVPMFLFAITIYYAAGYFLKEKRIAALSGMMFLVNGRMLIYDSMLGHIDIFYSWLTFISFMAIFYFYQRRNWFLLFFISYVITAITFLCKGLPSIVFQGFTILTLLIYTKNFKKFFSWQHIVAGIFCLLIIAAYFWNYSRFNSNLPGYFNTIWDQSAQRTAARTGLWKTLGYILLFPFEHLGHLFPVSLLVLFCFHKSFLRGVWNNEFLKYISLVFLVNIIVYWLSPQTRPRYLLMLYPLLFIVWSHAYFTYRNKLPVTNKIFQSILLILSVLLTLAVPAVFFADIKNYVGFLGLKAGIIFFALASCSFLICKLRSEKIFVFVALLVVVRLAFSWFVLPHRLVNGDQKYYKQAAVEMGSISGGKPFYFYQYHPPVVAIPFHDRLIFYIERTRMNKVKFTESDVKPGYYLTFDRNLKNPKAVLVKTYENNLKLFEIK